MRHEKTICNKVTISIKEIEGAFKTGNIDLIKLAKRLHSVRKDAQKMEAGLKGRKEVMVKAGLEVSYQKSKGNKLTGINKIANRKEETNKRIDFEVTVKEQGKLVYQNKVHGGVVSLVENIKDIDKFGVIDGQTQKFIFGHPLAYWFAFDQLRQNIEAKGVEITAAIQSGIMQNKFADPEIKRKIIKFANQAKE